MKIWSLAPLIIILCLGATSCSSGSDSDSTQIPSQLSRGLEYLENLNANTLATEQGAPAAATTAACPSFVEGTPLGIACLHCASPGARSQALEIARILKESCRRNIATTMLVDGTFGEDRDFLGEVVRVATEAGATLHLYLYLGNGPWQRRYDSIMDRGFGSTIPPEEFRSRIISDEGLRATYREKIRWAEPLMDYARSRGAMIYLIPILEDNNSAAAQRSMENLITETILPSIPFALGRNPCPGCYPGNDQSLAPGTFFDQHIHSEGESINHSGGLITNDGRSFSFPEEDLPNTMSFAAIQSIIQRAKGSNNTFVVWRKEYQGLSDEGNFPNPDLRSYPLPSAAEELHLKTLLSQ